MFKKLLSQTIVYGLSTVLVRVFPFILIPILTKLYAPTFFAPFVDFYSAAGIINVLLSHGMETTVFRYIQSEQNKHKVYFTAFVSILILTFSFLLVGLWQREFLAEAFKNPDKAHFLAWFVVILSFDALCVVPFVKLRVEQRPFTFGGIKIFNALTYFLLTLFFLIVLPNRAFTSDIFKPLVWLKNQEYGIGFVFLANLLASAFTFLLLSPHILKLKIQFSFSLWKKMMIYALPIMVAGLGGIINESMDKQFLKYLLPEDTADYQVGLYGAVYKMVTFMVLFRQAYLLGVEPFFFSHAKKDNASSTYAKLMYYFVVFNSIILLGVIANINLITRFYLAPQYFEGLGVVPIILIANVFLGIYVNLSIWYKLTDKTYFGALFTVIGALFTVVINLVFIPKFGYWASAYATLIAYIVMTAISYLFGRKYYPIEYPLVKILVYFSLSILLSLISYYLFDSNWIIGNVFFFGYLLLWLGMEGKNLKKLVWK